MSHLTIEAKANIEQADKVLYLVNEPLMQEWIQQSNKNTESLDFLYGNCELRIDTYSEITNYILSYLTEEKHICVVLYGHPTVFSKPALDAAIAAKKNGVYTKILPGISAEDCLFADLMIDPGSVGCLSVDATDLIVHQRKIDNTTHLLIWQISVVGKLNHPQINHENTVPVQLLVSYLLQYYDKSHEIILYIAAQYPGFEPTILTLPLVELGQTEIPRTATLYIPPINIAEPNTNILNTLFLKN